jgi:predicted alpha/beta superfamily hydrolase
VLSPSVWWNHKSIVGYVNEHAPQLWERPRIWLDVGDREGHKTLRDVELLARRLKANGWRPGETLHFEKVHGGTHDEASWATAGAAYAEVFVSGGWASVLVRH